MYTLTLSPQEVRTVMAALERLQSDEVESLEQIIRDDPAEQMTIIRTGANIVAAGDILQRLPRVSKVKVDLTFKK